MARSETGHRDDALDWAATPSHRAVYRLLSGPLAEKFDEERDVDVGRQGIAIDFEAIVARCFSPSEQVLGRAAWGLWNGEGQVNLRELLLSLDGENFEALADAMRIFK